MFNGTEFAILSNGKVFPCQLQIITGDTNSNRGEHPKETGAGGDLTCRSMERTSSWSLARLLIRAESIAVGFGAAAAANGAEPDAAFAPPPPPAESIVAFLGLDPRVLEFWGLSISACSFSFHGRFAICLRPLLIFFNVNFTNS